MLLNSVAWQTERRPINSTFRARPKSRAWELFFGQAIRPESCSGPPRGRGDPWVIFRGDWQVIANASNTLCLISGRDLPEWR